jgi:hypothetical protein
MEVIAFWKHFCVFTKKYILWERRKAAARRVWNGCGILSEKQ